MTQEAKILIGIGVVTLVLLFGAVFFLSKSPTPPAAGTPVDQNLLVRENSRKIATDSAKVTIVEFGDYQCPACGAAHPVIKQVLKDFSGKVNFVFRDFPFPQHLNAMEAAEAAESAGAQGKYWDMYDLLYQNQEEWSEVSNPREIFTSYAKQLNLNIDQFSSDMDTNKFVDKINKDKQDGEALGVNSTPTFFVNGEKINNWSYETFKQKIEELTKNP